MHSQCKQIFKQAVAALLNIILVPLVFILKIPQILIIAKNRSVEGLSYFGSNMEVRPRSCSS